MKKSKIFALIGIVIIISTVYYVKNYKGKTQVASNNTTIVEVPKADLAFSVISDVHGNSGKLNIAIQDLYSINNKMDALVLNGDTVDQGLESQYNDIKSVMDKNKKRLPEVVIANIGNHDYYNYNGDSRSTKAIEGFKNLYYDFSGETSIYHDKWVKGYHFISLGSESLNPNSYGVVNADLSKTQLNWLKVKLKEDYKAGKPIFVFLHQHLSTSITGWIGVVQRKELTSILSQYPEVVIFTSHTHVLLNVDNIKTGLPYTTVNTGGVGYSIKPSGYSIERLYNESQGVYVEVNENKVTVQGRDFANKGWVFKQDITK